MLRACARVLRSAGRIAFTTIELAEGLTPAIRRRLRDMAPRAAGTRRAYPDMLASAGFSAVAQRDLTEAYLTTARSWLSYSLPHRDELARVNGAEQVDERLQDWRDAIAAVERGWLRRTLYAARRSDF